MEGYHRFLPIIGTVHILIADNHVYIDILSVRVFLLFRDGDYLGFLPGHGVGFVCTLSSNRKLLHEVDDRI